jgi:hypothetical protein
MVVKSPATILLYAAPRQNTAFDSKRRKRLPFRTLRLAGRAKVSDCLQSRHPAR